MWRDLECTVTLLIKPTIIQIIIEIIIIINNKKNTNNNLNNDDGKPSTLSLNGVYVEFLLSS